DVSAGAGRPGAGALRELGGLLAGRALPVRLGRRRGGDAVGAGVGAAAGAAGAGRAPFQRPARAALRPSRSAAAPAGVGLRRRGGAPRGLRAGIDQDFHLLPVLSAAACLSSHQTAANRGTNASAARLSPPKRMVLPSSIQTRPDG